ncbi:uncharacterized protein LOC118414503 [Branchiostoma floridae]|uniref:Uncharacterized protein LOC118414503 n=1 Tax=Branchiostoma floridae TaxID=7739 RepID=A0A9J7L333_BRAFL|nr:uncharacterized protein LOC118414503 [Branchiostoma floridae]XP_035674484.1 uncharacterized protein LOC118414503 [Branchiostoma floridae]
MAGKMTLWLPTLAIAFFVFVWGSVPAEAEEKRLAELNIGSDRGNKLDREALAAKLKEIMGKRADKRIAQSIVTGAKASQMNDVERQQAIDSILEKLGKRSAEMSIGEDWGREADNEARRALLEEILGGKRKRLAELAIGSDMGKARDSQLLRDMVDGIVG